MVVTASGLTGGFEARAACAVAEGQGWGLSQDEAAYVARLDAANQANAGGAAGAQLQYGEPACFYLDDGTNTISCQVQASWCTTPVAAPVPPVRIQPVDPRPPRKWKPIFRHKPRLPHYGHGCRIITAEASDYSTRGAQALVTHTLDNALRQRTGRTLHSHGVRTHAPDCYRLGGHYARANIIQCRMTAKVCR